MKSLKLLSVLVCPFFTFDGFAADPTFTDAAGAGADFQLQGEYSGENCGAQVIALGEGKFHLVGWDSGLPGAVDGAQKNQEIDGALQGGAVHFKNAVWEATVANGELHGKGADGEMRTLKKSNASRRRSGRSRRGERRCCLTERIRMLGRTERWTRTAISNAAL